MLEASTKPAGRAAASLLKIIDQPVWLSGRDGHVLWANEAARVLAPFDERDPSIHMDDLLQSASESHWYLSDSHDEPRLLRLRTRHDGTALFVTAISGFENGTTIFASRRVQFVGIGPDELAHFATIDPVSGLLNREAFCDGLGLTLGTRDCGVVMSISIDRIASVYDAYGSSIADRVVRQFGRRLKDLVPRTAVLCRAENGRFAVMLAGEDISAVRAEAESLIARIHAEATPGYPLAEGMAKLTLSVGMAAWPEHGTEAAELLASADCAVSTLARQGWCGTLWYDPGFRYEQRESLEIVTALHEAISGDQLSIEYQPKISWPERALVGMEALARWTHPSRGKVSPGIFVPIAEQTGLIGDLGDWVMNAVCAQISAWRAQGLSVPTVAVNVSPRQLVNGGIDTLVDPLYRHGLPPDAVEIELTETEMMDRLPAVKDKIAKLRGEGFTITIDDFGTGHSSLSNLRRLPIDCLKIDRAFVEDLTQSQVAHDYLLALVSMARSLGLALVAEGVETAEQARLLGAGGVEVMQGYLFSRPLTAAAAAEILMPGSPTARA